MHVENINKELGFMKSILIVSSVHVYTITVNTTSLCQYHYHPPQSHMATKPRWPK